MHPKSLSIADYDYELPVDRIAVFPLAERDQSKLLIEKNGGFSEDVYQNISHHLPENTFLVFNDTKVIKARMLFQKDTGATIEIFCLEPYEPLQDYVLILQKENSIRWKCMIGGAGKWKEKYLKKNILINDEIIEVKAELIEKLSDAYVIEISWTPGHYSFSEIIEQAGNMPLPPYIKRKAEIKDAETYQTIYSAHEGSVAAPTAGLHFTQNIFDSFSLKNITKGFVTLHVGAGTFKPVKAHVMIDHEMHSEWMDVHLDFLNTLLLKTDCTFCVGTTSVRTIESLYWMGLRAFYNPAISDAELMIQQWDVYENKLNLISAEESVKALIQMLAYRKTDRLFIPTQIIIAPGYTFKIVKGMITNFHQPKSTLLLLVAAMLGPEWKKLYQYALDHQFRFLSYGDGCLIHPRYKW